jgi:hypothetical protein
MAVYKLFIIFAMRLLDKPTARTSDAWFANQTDAFFVSSFSQHLQFLPLLGGGNVARLFVF